MIFSLLIVIIPTLIVLALIAKRSFDLTKPAIYLTALGIIGAVFFMIGLSIGGEQDLPAISVLGTAMSLLALIGLLALILIWAIRKWGLPAQSERHE